MEQFGSVTPQDTARDMLLTAFDAGITYFDLANNYGPRPGAAEETLGKIMDSDLRPHRDELILATKAGWAPCRTARMATAAAASTGEQP